MSIPVTGVQPKSVDELTSAAPPAAVLTPTTQAATNSASAKPTPAATLEVSPQARQAYAKHHAVVPKPKKGAYSAISQTAASLPTNTPGTKAVP